MKLFIYQSLTQFDYRLSKMLQQALVKLMKVKVFCNDVLLQENLIQSSLFYKRSLGYQYKIPFTHLDFRTYYVLFLVKLRALLSIRMSFF